MAKFELTPVQNKETGKYEIAKFEEVIKNVKDFIKERHFDKIETDLDYKGLKEVRTEIRSRQDLIKEVRLQVNDILLGRFNEQAKEIEAMLGEEDANLKKLKDAWDAEHNKVSRPKTISVVCKTYDAKIAEKIKAYALKLGAGVEVK